MNEEKKVYSLAEWDFKKQTPGDLVQDEVVRHFMDMVSPAAYTGSIAQVGSPYSLRIDPDTGRTRDVYATFKGTGHGWQFCGYCFRYETEERGTEPDYIKNL